MAAMTCSTRWLTGAVEPTQGHDAASASAPLELGLATLSPTKATATAARTARARLARAPVRQMDDGPFVGPIISAPSAVDNCKEDFLLSSMTLDIRSLRVH